MSELGDAVRATLRADLADLAGRTDVAVALSAGVDSTSCLLALLDLDVRPTAVTFTLDHWLSTDASLALQNARTLGLPTRVAFLPLDVETLLADVRYLVSVFGVRGKAKVECAWPMLYALRACVEEERAVLVTGVNADVHFGLSKKAMIHHRHSAAALDEYRREKIEAPDGSGYRTWQRMGEAVGVEVRHPWRSPAIVDLFLGREWDEVNRPRQKEPIRAAYEDELRALTVRPHTNLQLGDSRIAEHFRALLGLPEFADCRTVVSVYNRLGREVSVA